MLGVLHSGHEKDCTEPSTRVSLHREQNTTTGTSSTINRDPASGVSWHDPKVLAAGLLWLVFTILLYLRYSQHLRGRKVALWTIAAFTLLLVIMAWPHLGVGGGP